MDYEVVGEFVETASGRLVRRPEQDKVMKLVRGRHVHTVAVVKLDRWGRSIIDLKNTIGEMAENGVVFTCINQGFEFERKTAQGNLLLNQLGAYAEFEADMISDRTKEALAAKVKSGKPWVSKTGRTVSKLGPDFKPCTLCGGPRQDQTRKKQNGKVIMVCRPCKGLPALPAKKEPEKVVYVQTQVGEPGAEQPPGPPLN